MRDCSEGCHKHNMDFIVIGDTKSPHDFSLSGCQFLSIEKQRKLPFGLATLAPERHYARKNIGYLVAMERGAELIIETDDDNFPYEEFWSERHPYQKVNLVENAGWINVYRYFTDATIWPRGFPIEHIKKPAISMESYAIAEIYCPIQQGLADKNPDVDAIYRLTSELPLTFNNSVPMAIGNGSWTPFNSQNTTWFKEAFPLLYIPSYCNFRMCDIWRSFIALRICHANDWGILFHGPTVWQERNEHNLINDFEDEIPGYLKNTKICHELSELDIKSGKDYLIENLLKCYKKLIDINVIGSGELPLLNAWINDFTLIS